MTPTIERQTKVATWPRRFGELAAYLAMLAAAVALFLLIDRIGTGLIAPEAIDAGARSATVKGNSLLLVHVLIALVAVVVAGQLLGRLFRYIKQPPVIGEVVAGIILGPSLLGQLWPEASAFLLPANVGPFIGVIAQIGVVLYMFLGRSRG